MIQVQYPYYIVNREDNTRKLINIEATPGADIHSVVSNAISYIRYFNEHGKCELVFNDVKLTINKNSIISDVIDEYFAQNGNNVDIK